MRMRQPHAATLAAHFVDDVLRRHVLRIHILVDIQAYKVMLLPAEGIVRVQLGPLDRNKTIGHFDAIDARYLVMIGETEEIVALCYITVQTLLRRRLAVRIGRMRMEIALEPAVAVRVFKRKR